MCAGSEGWGGREMLSRDWGATGDLVGGGRERKRGESLLLEGLARLCVRPLSAVLVRAYRGLDGNRCLQVVSACELAAAWASFLSAAARSDVPTAHRATAQTTQQALARTHTHRE